MAAFDAKSAESLTLINRGSGQGDQARYAELAANVKAILADAAERGGSAEADVQSTFAEFDALHTDIRSKDDGGDWDGAVALATGTGSGSANELFAQFDQASSAALADSSRSLRHDLGTARTPLLILSWVGLAAGILAALLAWRGISNRLREYR